MLTQEMVTVLLIALVVNGIVVASLILAPRLRDWSRRRSIDGEIDGGRATTDRPAWAGSAAAQPWFLASSTNGASHGEPAAAAHRAAVDELAPDEGADLEEPEEAMDLVAAVGSDEAVVLPELAPASTWASWLAEEAARAARYHRPATIVFVELAGLDRLAERVGRTAADRLLPPVAVTIRRHARSADRLARLSSTRFGILLVETDEVSAINYVERIRSNCDVWLAAGAVSLRLSIGWAEIRADRSVEVAAREAEQRLFADRRRSEPVDPETAAGDRDGLSSVLQATGS